MEEQVYAQLWKLDEQKKIEREREELEQKKMAGAATIKILDWQKSTRQQELEKNKDHMVKERSMLNKQWTIEQQQESDMENQKFILNRERNIELIQHNEQER